MIENFRVLVQKVLPTVYDDSLSYYELLNKVVHYLNTTIDQVNNLTDAFNKVLTEVLPENVEQVLNTWYADGTLANLINIDLMNTKADKTALDIVDQKVSNLDLNLSNKASTLQLDEVKTDVSNVKSIANSKVDTTTFNQAIGNIGSGSPKAIYSTLSDLQTAYPTGATGIYVVIDNGNWYYWNGAWTSGGIYQGTSLNNGSITGEKLSDQYNFKRTLTSADDFNTIFESGVYYWNGDISNPINQPLPLNGSGMMKVTKGVGVFTIQEAWPVEAPHVKFTRKIESNPVGNTPWKSTHDLANRYIAYIGDSISVPGTYQQIIKDELNAYIHNYAYSGAAIAQYGNNNPFDPYSFVGRSTSIPLPTYLKHVFVFMGTNDFSNDMPLGAVNSENPYDFRGAIRLGIKNIIQRRPDVKIAFATPMFKATLYDLVFQDVLTTPNGIGLYLKDYINAMVEVCESMGIPVFNTFNKANINKYNYTTYLADMIHPNDAGQRRLGHLFSNFLKEVF